MGIDTLRDIPAGVAEDAPLGCLIGASVVQ